MKTSNAELKCTWTNGGIWIGISAAVSLLLSAALWYFLIYAQDANIFFMGFCMSALAYLLFPAVLMIIWFAMTYQGYMKRAAQHPEDLYGVAHGRYGSPWVLSLILQIVVGLLWIVASLFVIALSNDMTMDYEYDIICFQRYLIVAGIGFVVNLVLFLVGAFCFQPNLVKQKK